MPWPMGVSKYSKLQVKPLQSGLPIAENKMAIIYAVCCLWSQNCCLCNCPGFRAALTGLSSVRLLSFMDLWQALKNPTTSEAGKWENFQSHQLKGLKELLKWVSPRLEEAMWVPKRRAQWCSAPFMLRVTEISVKSDPQNLQKKKNNTHV